MCWLLQGPAATQLRNLYSVHYNFTFLQISTTTLYLSLHYWSRRYVEQVL